VAFDYRKDSRSSGTCRLYSVGPEDEQYRRGNGGKHDRELCFMEPRCALGDPSCRGMRFRVYNSRNSGDIVPREVIFLESVDTLVSGEHPFLQCDESGCKADSKCPTSPEHRQPPTDTTKKAVQAGCSEERFQLFTTYGA